MCRLHNSNVPMSNISLRSEAVRSDNAHIARLGFRHLKRKVSWNYLLQNSKGV